jgi:hypothetical protein
MEIHEFNLFADYYEFYLQDESAEGNLSDSWTDLAIQRMLALAPGTIGVGTVRNTTVPVVVEVSKSEPMEDISPWDHVNECSIDLPSGQIVVAGCTDYFPDAARIKVSPGCYRARLFYGDLDTLSKDGLDGKDHYKVALWPALSGEAVVIKQRQGLKEGYPTQ